MIKLMLAIPSIDANAYPLSITHQTEQWQVSIQHVHRQANFSPDRLTSLEGLATLA